MTKNKKLTKAMGEHFNLKGHKQSDLKVSIIEKLNSTSENFRKQREKMYIKQERLGSNKLGPYHSVWG